jgi:glyoxylase-like metal-dependent hydrolase (beta-lactamase superfamily II)
MNIVNAGYQSTNYYVIDLRQGKLLVDCGWPGSLGQLKHNLQAKGTGLTEIRYLLVTHYHPDHAGLAQELKDIGVKLIVMEGQTASIPLMKKMIKGHFGYHEIRLDDNVVFKPENSRAFLAKAGLGGEIVPTPGHSGDSITLILDSGAAFTGDLPGWWIYGDAQPVIHASWERIFKNKVETVYPGHGSPRSRTEEQQIADSAEKG